jgi:glycine reductase
MHVIKVVHYLNQFFGQIGGEDQADVPPQVKEGSVGPGKAFDAAFGEAATIVGTVICGDNYFAENTEQATREVLELIKSFEPDLVVAGPAFNAGRYGPACGAVCQAVTRDLGIPAITGMYPENPGVELYGKDIFCVQTGSSAAGMRQAVPVIAKLGLRLATNAEIGSPEEEGYLPRGVRKPSWAAKNGAARAVEMLLAKIKGEPFVTELPMPAFDKVAPAAPVADLAHAVIALVTEGGIVPKGNPDRLESARATKYLQYSLEHIDDLSGEAFQSVHGGYSTVSANQDPDRVLPVDALRDLERDGEIGSLYESFYTTTGNGTSLENSRKFGKEIAERLIASGVQAAILTST